MRQVEVLDPNPTVIHCNINIVHLQLRDLLQPAGEKGKVLFINRLRIDCADFTTKKVPTAFCTLDFAPVCLTTGSGLVAAGGQQSELDIRPLLPLPVPSNEPSGSGQGSSRNGGNHGESDRRVPRWHLRTPTGGSINNSICIQPDLAHCSSSHSSPGTSQLEGKLASLAHDRDHCSHREKRRKEGYEETQDGHGSLLWRRDDPSGRLGAAVADALGGGDMGKLGLDALVERDRIGVEASEEERRRRSEEATRAEWGEVFTDGLLLPSASQGQRPGASVRVLVSNNDHSVKEFRLRPPMKWKSTASGDGSERIESGLPGLSRLQTVDFPTCINHSSFSPDGRHLVSVGDTPDVFLYSVDQVSGELSKIATYTASSDDSFSTSWSPDCMRFAVASQDGVVSVWDVRSACKIATLKTSQSTDVGGSGAARVVKWSPRGDLLAYSEHQNYFHVVDTATFSKSQRIKVPVGGSGARRNAACNREGTPPLGQGESPVEGDDTLHSSTDSNGSLSASNALLESTSPARFATTGRSSAANNHPPTRSSWLGIGRGTNRSIRSPLDRALLGEWTSSRRGGEGRASHFEGFMDDRQGGRAQSANNNTSSGMLARTVDSIMSTFEDDSSAPRGAGIWGLGPPSYRFQRDEGIDISGLTWDPDGDFLYVSTVDLIAQYSVLELRRSFGQGAIR